MVFLISHGVAAQTATPTAFNTTADGNGIHHQMRPLMRTVYHVAKEGTLYGDQVFCFWVIFCWLHVPTSSLFLVAWPRYYYPPKRNESDNGHRVSEW
jgi:hypothetical protein